MTNEKSKIHLLYCIQTTVKDDDTKQIIHNPFLSVQTIEFDRFAELDLSSDFSVFDSVIFRIEKLDSGVEQVIEQYLKNKKNTFYFIYDDVKQDIVDKYQQNSNFLFLPYIPQSSPYIQLLLKKNHQNGNRKTQKNYFAEKFKACPFPFLVFGMRGKAKYANKQFFNEFLYEQQDISKITLKELIVGISANTILKSANDKQALFPQTYSCSILNGQGNLVPCEAHFSIHETDSTSYILLFFKNLSKLNQQEKIVGEQSFSLQRVSQIIDLLSKREDIDFYDESINKKLLELFSADYMTSIPIDDESGKMEFSDLKKSDEVLIQSAEPLILTALSVLRPSIFQIDQTKLTETENAFRSVFIIPLLSEKKLLGIMAFFYLNPFEPSLLQVELAEMVSRLFGNHLSKVLYLKKLHASEKLFKTAVENAINGIYQTTQDGKILFVNKALLKLLGYESLEEMQNLESAEELYITPDERKKFIRELEKNKIITNCYVKLKRKDGSAIIAIENAYVLHDAKGRPFYQGSLRNIESYQKFQRELKKTNKFTMDFLDKTGFIVAGFDQRGILRIWNRLAARLTGFTRAEIGEKEAFINLVKESTKNKSQQSSEYGLLKTSIETKEQKILTIVWDVENTNHPNYGRMEIWIGMRFGDEPFSTERDLSQETDVNLHSERLTEYFDKILQAGIEKNISLQELHRIFSVYRKTYLKYSDIMPLTEIADRPINAMEIAEQTILLLKNLIPEKIKLFENLEFSGFVRVKKKALETVFEQLLVNAIESISGGGKISFSSKMITSADEAPQRAEKGGFSLPAVLFSITDTGEGIGKDEIRTVKEPFTTSKNPLEHAGLGLYMANQIVSAVGGKLWIDSEAGNGTNVTVLFPAEKINQEDEKEITQEEQKTSVLVVDDESVIRELITDVLNSKNINVILASNGMEGYEKFLTNKDDIRLVILDIIMPEMDGKELFYKIKKIKKDVKVIVISGYSKHNVKDELLQAGVDHYLSKPFNINELTDLLDTVFPEHNKS